MLNGRTIQPDIFMIMTIFTMKYPDDIWVSEWISKVDYLWLQTTGYLEVQVHWS